MEWHLDLLGATKDAKDYRIKWCKRQMDLCIVPFPRTMRVFSFYELILSSKNCREVVIICSGENLTARKRTSANVARYENNFLNQQSSSDMLHQTGVVSDKWYDVSFFAWIFVSILGDMFLTYQLLLLYQLLFSVIYLASCNLLINSKKNRETFAAKPKKIG